MLELEGAAAVVTMLVAWLVDCEEELRAALELEALVEVEGAVELLVNETLLEEQTIFAGIWEEFSMYSLIIQKVVAATELVETVRQIRGVHEARIEFVDEHIDQSKILANYIERRPTVGQKLLVSARTKRARPNSDV